MMKRLSIHIFGLVQGVCFRAYAKEKADELGVFGFVKNSDDGSVFIDAEGEEKDVKKFLEWCKIGPSSAKVEKVGTNWHDDLVRYNSFSIER